MDSGLIRNGDGVIPAFPIHSETVNQSAGAVLDLTDSDLFIVFMPTAGTLTVSFSNGEIAINFPAGAVAALHGTATAVSSTVPIVIS
ncbi:hypothetical protein N9Y67_00035 [Pseudomonadota bacterium]|nr:hypothetical protein [Pseudomonadota bacterium]